MGKKKKIPAGKIESKPENLTKNLGHEYGKGRTTVAHKHKNVKREKQKIKNELRNFY